MLDFSRLSPAQRRIALAADGPLLVVAGPGSGKTTVLAARIAYLVAGRGISPTSILALTFAKKAADELRARLRTLLGAPGQAVDVATFHAFGLRIVRQWSAELDYGLGPITVYGAEEIGALIREAAGGLEPGGALPLPSDVRAEFTRYRLSDGGESSAPPAVAALAARYEALLRRRGAVDYPAMLALPLRLFRQHRDALRCCRSAYRYVLADEFQDVCASQYTLLRLLAERHRDLLVVGDPRQCLYGWRGADPRFFHEFRRDFPDATTAGLTQNFRSSGAIVDLANAIGAGGSGGQCLWTDNPSGQAVSLHTAPDERAEADYVGAEVDWLRRDGRITSPGEVAVLYRVNHQAQEIALALRARGVPYRVAGGHDLFARPDVRDAIAYLRLAHNPADVAALARVVNTPPRGLGRLADRLRSNPVPLDQLPGIAGSLGQAAPGVADELGRLIRGLHARGGRERPAGVLDRVLDETGYSLGHLAELRCLALAAEEDLGTWLDDLQLGEEGPPGTGEGDRVTLSTIHRVKGAEWRVVFVVGLEEGLLPHHRSLPTDPLGGDPREEQGDIEGERRVLYVAVTRARELLYLTRCRTRRRGDLIESRRPSRFLRRVPSSLLARAT